MLVLSLADFNATREMGPLLALGIVVMMGCGVTLLPALLAAFGRRAFWPAIPREEAEPREASAGWTRVGALVRRRPALLVGVSVGVLVLGALGNLDGRGHLDLSEQYRDPPESAQGQALIRDRFDPPGRVGPVAGRRPTPRSRSRSRTRSRRRPASRSSNTDSQSDGRPLRLVGGAAERSTRSRREAMDLIPRLREVARQGRGRASWR